MKDSLQFGDSHRKGARLPGSTFLGRLAAAIVGLGVLGVAIFLGAIFLAVVIGLMLIAGIFISVRVWWLKRQMERYAREHGDLDAEYVEIRETEVSQIRQIDKQDRDSR